MQITRKNAITRRLIIGIVLGFLVFLVLILISDLREVSQRVLNFRWALFPAVLGLTLFNYLLRGYKFHYYLRQIGAKKITLRESFRLFIAGIPLAVTPGKAGEVLKGVWIHNQTRESTARGIAVVLAERISDGLAVLLLSTLGVIAYPDYWPAFMVILVIMVSIIVVSQIRPIALKILYILDRIPLVKRFTPVLHEFYEGSFALFKPRATLIAVVLGMASWLGEGIGFYLILVGLGIPPVWETFSIAVFVLAFSTIVGAVSALPGGLGAAEASISGMLILLLKISSDTAAAATLLIRFATLWFGVGLGLVVWSFSSELLGLKNQESDKKEPSDE